jgi:hypothetical protein
MKRFLAVLLLIPAFALGQQIKEISLVGYTNVYYADSLYAVEDTIMGTMITVDSLEVTVGNDTAYILGATADTAWLEDDMVVYSSAFAAGVTMTRVLDTLFLSDTSLVSDTLLGTVRLVKNMFDDAVVGAYVKGPFHPHFYFAGSPTPVRLAVTEVIDTNMIVVGANASSDTGNTAQVNADFGWYRGATTAYGDGDIIGFPFPVPLSVGDYDLLNVVIHDSAGQGGDYEIVFYDSVIAPTSIDNAAYALTWEEHCTAIGWVSVDSSWGGVAGGTAVAAYNLGEWHSLKTAKPVYGVLISNGTPTFTSGQDLRIRMFFSKR